MPEVRYEPIATYRIFAVFRNRVSFIPGLIIPAETDMQADAVGESRRYQHHYEPPGMMKSQLMQMIQ